MTLHPYAIAQNGAAGIRTRRIHRDHANRLTFIAQHADDLIAERALPRPRRAGDAQNHGSSGAWKQFAK